MGLFFCFGGIFIKLKEYIKEDKPREKLFKNGAESLSDSELLQIILRVGSKERSVNELSNDLLKEYGSLNNLCNSSYNSLIKIKGIKDSKASILLSVFEICKRINHYSKKIKLNNTLSIYHYFKDEFSNLKQEVFYVLLFDKKMNLISKKKMFVGTIDSISVHPREVFKYAIDECASFIVCIHNHPSGDTTPSSFDREFTNVLIKTGDIVGIKFLDHLIISGESYYSFYEEANK